MFSQSLLNIISLVVAQYYELNIHVFVEKFLLNFVITS